MTSGVSYYIVFHCVSAGVNGVTDLGSDEADIIFIVFIVIDSADKKVVSIHEYPLKPPQDINDNEKVTLEASTLKDAIEHFDVEVAKRLNYSFIFFTEGQLHIRQCLMPEANRKNIELPLYFYRFYDLGKEYALNCKHLPPSLTSVLSVDDMFWNLGLESRVQERETTGMPLKHANRMASIILKLIGNGATFHEPDVINTKLVPVIRSKSDKVDSKCCAKARGLPWQASDEDIAKFFIGLNIAPGGVALCLSTQGRRNGEAIILFENSFHRDMALNRHKHHIGTRYIEVYTASGEEFINVAGGCSKDAKDFLSRGGKVIIRMRGLPYDATAQQVVEFFKCNNGGGGACSVMDGEDGVLFVRKYDRRSTGDAFVLFSDEKDGEKAVLKHKQLMGSRYIELFRSTMAEVQQVLNRTLEPERSVTSSCVGGSNSNILANTVVSGSIPPVNAAAYSQHLITTGTQKDCIRITDLPLEAQVENILEYLADHARNISYHGVHMVYNALGQATGEAFIQMKSEQAALFACQQKHQKCIIVRNIPHRVQVLQCSGEDMNNVLTGAFNVCSSTNVPSLNLLTPPTMAGGLLSPTACSPFNPFNQTLYNQLLQSPTTLKPINLPSAPQLWPPLNGSPSAYPIGSTAPPTLPLSMPISGFPTPPLFPGPSLQQSPNLCLFFNNMVRLGTQLQVPTHPLFANHLASPRAQFSGIQSPAFFPHLMPQSSLLGALSGAKRSFEQAFTAASQNIQLNKRSISSVTPIGPSNRATSPSAAYSSLPPQF